MLAAVFSVVLNCYSQLPTKIISGGKKKKKKKKKSYGVVFGINKLNGVKFREEIKNKLSTRLLGGHSNVQWLT